jgi:hypothetical protein
MTSYYNNHEYTWISSDGKAHNHTDHILTDYKRHSNLVDVLFVRASDFDTDHYLVVANVTETVHK